MPGIKMGAAIMAGGEGKRFGSNKLLADAGGKTVLERTLENIFPALREKAEEIILVTRYPACVEIVRNRFPGIHGIVKNLPEKSDTVRTAAEYFGYAAVDGILYLQADQMLLTGRTLERLLDAFARDPEIPARLSFEGRPGSPVIFPGSDIPKLAALKGDVGGRVILSGRKVQLVEAACSFEMWDVDTREDLQRMLKSEERI